MTTLVVLEHDNASLSSASLSAITAATMLPAPRNALVIGHDCAAVADQAAALEGLDAVTLIDAPTYSSQLAEVVAPAIAQQCGDCSHVIAAATTFGKDVMPRLAALLDVMIIADITAVIDEQTYERPTYAGNIITEVKSHDSVKVITARPTSFAATSDRAGDAAPVNTLDCQVEAIGSELLELSESGSDRPELGTAKIVVSGGRGLGSAENFRRITSLADRLGAAVGASRAAVDAGYVPNDFQVGQTGKVVAPELYIAIGISGAIQHLAGMKESKIIVAINKDPEAPIFQVADYGLVGDLNDLLPQLEKELANAGIG